MRIGIVVFLFSIPAGLFAQTPAIRSVVNFASNDARFSPGVVAAIRYQSDTPFDGWTVQVGGKPVPVGDEEDGATLDIQLPADQPLGPTTVTITTRGGTSAAYPITVEPYAPGLLAPSRTETIFDPSPFGCNQTAKAGDVLTIVAVGLGETSAAAPGQPAPTLVKPVLTVGGRAAELLESVLSRPGFYRLRFIVPPGNGYHLVSLAIAGYQSNYVTLPVGKAMLNIASATFRQGPAAPDSLETAYSCTSGPLAKVDRSGVAGDPKSLPTSLGGVSITVKDSAGVARLALLYGVAPDQVNYVVPSGTAVGLATVTLNAADGSVSESDLDIRPVAPSVFFGFQVVRLRNGIQTVETGTQGAVDMGPDTDAVFLVLYASGLRFRSSLANVTANIGGVDAPVEYAGAQTILPGLDQVNIRLPRSLAGRGAVTLELSVDGSRANDTFLIFK